MTLNNVLMSSHLNEQMLEAVQILINSGAHDKKLMKASGKKKGDLFREAANLLLESEHFRGMDMNGHKLQNRMGSMVTDRCDNGKRGAILKKYMENAPNSPDVIAEIETLMAQWVSADTDHANTTAASKAKSQKEDVDRGEVQKMVATATLGAGNAADVLDLSSPSSSGGNSPVSGDDAAARGPKRQRVQAPQDDAALLKMACKSMCHCSVQKMGWTSVHLQFVM
jgi:hypothetical protein